ncbi:MAG: hypothetical protein QOG62_2297 [Thermoleophilaceae bacterium]|jgi:AcrR family transcriptional regulator|nr:hypothetical protein [Thermoleophilaceae bacterium]
MTVIDHTPRMSKPIELPVLDQAPAERADATRNRQRILEAADRLFAEHGVENVSMDAIAAEACVGKGTLFRRFGDRPGLARGLLERREAYFQESFIRGGPPLGPGAQPRDRLLAFADARMDLLEIHGDLILAAETGRMGIRFEGPYGAHRIHVVQLLREAAPGLDAEYAAEALLGCLSAEYHLFMRRARGRSLDQVRAGFRSLVDQLLG